MATLTIIQNGTENRISFSGTPLLDEVLQQAGYTIPHPCGGIGQCGKCRVWVAGQVTPLTAAEAACGSRLSCQTRLLGDATVILTAAAAPMAVEIDTAPLTVGAGEDGRVGVAVDIGTTTLAVKAYDLGTGAEWGVATAINPQVHTAADVIGRIAAVATAGMDALRTPLVQKLRHMVNTVLPVNKRADRMVITGNTTMLYLLVGEDPAPLGRAPFIAARLFGEQHSCDGTAVYLLPCIGAFVGADITCAVLAAGMCDRPATALLCDVGTNGEIALWKDGTLYVSSTAAGPAFEGYGISCGCPGAEGAVHRVWAEDGRIRYATIGNMPPVGLCGTGLLDAIATGLARGLIDDTGAMARDMDIAEGVFLTQEDVRAVQVAKAAVAAGIDTVLAAADTTAEEIDAFYICGGFGSRLDPSSAAAVGLFPSALASKAIPLGNAALDGAARVLADPTKRAALEAIARVAIPVELGGNATFYDRFIRRMPFA